MTDWPGGGAVAQRDRHVSLTDVEGSTALLTRIGKEAYGELLAEHHRLIRAAVSDVGGSEVDTQGEAFFAAFPSATDAVTTAARLQRAAGDLNAAARLLGAAEALHERLGQPVEDYAVRAFADGSAPVRHRLGEGELAAAWAAGRKLSEADAAAYALDTLGLG